VGRAAENPTIMRTRHSPTRRLVPFTTLLLAACPILYAAEPPAAESPLSATVSVSSQYISRGIRQTWGRPAAQASVDYVHPSGWTAMIYWYKYPGARIAATNTSFDYGELSAGISWKSLYARYNYTISHDFFGIRNARGTGYLDVGADHPLSHTLTLNLHAGDGHVAGSGNGIWDWRDLKAGLTRRLEGGWVAAVNVTRAFGATNVYERYTTGVPRPDGRVAISNVARRAVVFSLTRKF